MIIGRTDEPGTPLIATVPQRRPFVWGWFADPIWASGRMPRQTGRTNDRTRTVCRICCRQSLASGGPSTHAICPVSGRGSTVAWPGLCRPSLALPSQNEWFQRASALGGGPGGKPRRFLNPASDRHALVRRNNIRQAVSGFFSICSHPPAAKTFHPGSSVRVAVRRTTGYPDPPRDHTR